MSFLTVDDINRIFSHHPPKSVATAANHEEIRKEVRELALKWNRDLPSCPEKTIAIRRLQEAMMFANSAIAQASAE